MDVIRTLVSNGISQIVISRPKALNALNHEIMQELEESFRKLRDDPAITGIILSGDGDKAFVAGADISELRNLNREQAFALATKGQNLFKLIQEFPKPVIAAVNGFALGGGCELAMACHIRFATAMSKFGQPEVNLGIIPGYGGTQRLPQLIGKGKALELLLTGDMIGAIEAEQMGLVNRVFPDFEEMMREAFAVLGKIATKSPLAIARIIQSVNGGFSFENAGFETEANCFADSTTTNDFKEGTSAFLEKRKPVFKGN